VTGVPVGGRRQLGQAGEAAVADWYVANGYEIIARNWRCRDGELDLIAVRSRVVVFCEVKSRSSEAFGTPAEAVTPVKQRRIRRLAAQWLQGQTAIRPRAIRFDVAGVLRGEVEILEGAF
jgi:putative endonuclease